MPFIRRVARRSAAGSIAGWIFAGFAVFNANAQTQVDAHNRATAASKNLITINVVVTDKKGQALQGLEAQDFTLLDNGRAKQIVDFRAIVPETLSREPARVVIVVDTINSDLTLVAKARDELARFLQRDDARLTNPTTLAFLSDSGLKVDRNFTKDGNELDAALEKVQPALRTIDRSTLGGIGERFKMSTGQFTELAAWAAGLPGRKMLLIISPGWPLLPGVENQSSTMQRKWLFNSIVKFTNGLRQFQVTVYSIDPFDLERAAPFYYRSFLKGVSDVGDAQFPNLSLQVIAEHSGGAVVIGSKDIGAELQTAIRDAAVSYQVTFEGAEEDHPNTYHALQLRVDRPNTVVRTSAGYYAHMQFLGN